MVATLTLVKSSYRLGETVNGSVVINSGEGRVLRVGTSAHQGHDPQLTTVALGLSKARNARVDRDVHRDETCPRHAANNPIPARRAP